MKKLFARFAKDESGVTAIEYGLIATLRTSTTPTQMAMTFDRQYLIVGHDNSQFAYVYNLDTLQPDTPITFPGGHYPRQIAESGKSILALVRDVSVKQQLYDLIAALAKED